MPVQYDQMLRKCLIPLTAVVALWGPAAVEAFIKPSLTLPLRSSALRPTPRYASTFGSTSDYTKPKPKVVVLGGGFGGLYTALRLAQLAKPHPHALPSFDITLVDRSDSFVFLPLLYELAVGDALEDEVTPTFDRLLASSGVHFERGEVVSLDRKARKAVVKPFDQTGSENVSLPYDRLVVALGSESTTFGVPGAAEYSMPFYRKEDAMRLREKLRMAEEKASPSLLRVVIVGGGYSGVELACNLANRLGRDRSAVTLVDRGLAILKNSPDQVRAQANKRLEEEGVEVFLGVDVLSVGPESVIVQDNTLAPSSVASVTLGEEPGSQEGNVMTPKKTAISADLVIWTAGASVNRLVSQLAESLARDSRGKVQTDRFLRVKSDLDIFVLGDNAAVSGLENLPSTAQVAFQQSEVASWNVWSSLLGPVGPKPLTFNYTPLGEMLTLGSTQAAISSLEGMVSLGGPYASLIRRLVYILRMPTKRQRGVAAKSWIQARLSKITKEILGKDLIVDK